MTGFDREILETQIREIFEQLVSNGFLNVCYPVSGNTTPWADFYFGHPDTCHKSLNSPFFFMYGLDFLEDFDTLCTDKMIVSMVIGVEAMCKDLIGNSDDFDKLWYKIRRALGRNSGSFEITGTYTLTNDDGTISAFLNPNFSSLGIRNTATSGNTRLSINNGEKIRYSSQLDIEMFFNHSIPKL